MRSTRATRRSHMRRRGILKHDDDDDESAEYDDEDEEEAPMAEAERWVLDRLAQRCVEHHLQMPPAAAPKPDAVAPRVIIKRRQQARRRHADCRCADCRCAGADACCGKGGSVVIKQYWQVGARFDPLAAKPPQPGAAGAAGKPKPVRSLLLSRRSLRRQGAGGLGGEGGGEDDDSAPAQGGEEEAGGGGAARRRAGVCAREGESVRESACVLRPHALNPPSLSPPPAAPPAPLSALVHAPVSTAAGCGRYDLPLPTVPTVSPRGARRDAFPHRRAVPPLRPNCRRLPSARRAAGTRPTQRASGSASSAPAVLVVDPRRPRPTTTRRRRASSWSRVDWEGVALGDVFYVPRRSRRRDGMRRECGGAAAPLAAGRGGGVSRGKASTSR